MSYKILEPCWSPNYTNRHNPAVGIVIHHAATTDFYGIGRTFQNSARQASAHWGVAPGMAQQYVPEDKVAWHAGNTWANNNTIGIETVNSGGAPFWPVSEAAIDTLVELVADIAKRHNMGKLVVGKNLWGHKDFSATFCPGVLYPRLQEIANRANAINYGGKQPKQEEDDVNFVTIPEGGADVYRLYNPNSSEHLLTIDANEVKNLTKAGWINEGVSWRCADSGDLVYRFSLPNRPLHMWTKDPEEFKKLKEDGWKCEGVAFASARSGKPIYRLRNDVSQQHVWTPDKYERDTLVKGDWIDEGVPFYAM